MMDRRQFSSLVLAGALAAVASPGLGAGKVKLLFVHGRGQAGLHPDDLKASWLGALSKGADATGSTLPAPLDVAFPFYGDVLEQFVARADLPLTPDIQAHGGAGQNDEFLSFQSEVAQAIRERSGVTDQEVLREYGDSPKPHGSLNWEWVRAILIAIDKQARGLSSLLSNASRAMSISIRPGQTFRKRLTKWSGRT